MYFNLQEVGYFELLEQYYHKYSQLGKVSIIGDLNSRFGHKSDIIINTDDYDRFIPREVRSDILQFSMVHMLAPHANQKPDAMPDHLWHILNPELENC